MTERAALVYGAGSIGNHLAHACRRKGWSVTLVDTDPEALRRTRESIYPGRYGAWDPAIRLLTRAEREKGGAPEADLVILGTPPDTHLTLATEVLERNPPRVLLVEKPLCPPGLEGLERFASTAARAGTTVLLGYNHTLTPGFLRAAEILRSGRIGEPLTLQVRFREHWGGIFRAHPWLKGPWETYLGYSARGGGAGGEHSHGIHLWLTLARLCGAGGVREVSAAADWVDDGVVRFDRILQMSVRTGTGLLGTIELDVVTDPADKSARVQGTKGFVEWSACPDGRSLDRVRFREGDGPVREEIFAKTRPDDFKGEIDHVEALLDGRAEGASSPLALERGIETMLVLAAAHASARYARPVRADGGEKPTAVREVAP